MKATASIPADWAKSSIGKYCHVQLGKMLQNDPSSEKDSLKPYLRAINIAKDGLDLTHQFSMWIRPQESERFKLKPADILVSEGGDAGRTCIFTSEEEYYFQNAINRVRPQDPAKICAEFTFYWFTFLKLSGYVEMVCNVATIAHFTAEKVKAAPLALPPLDTQRRIAAFLDEKTAQIDGLISKKRELLERLAEKRQALITQAVTKGLYPDAPMKPSGIDWLGDIPAHWAVLPFNRLLSSSTYGISASLEPSGGVIILRMGNLIQGQVSLEDVRYLNEVDSCLMLRDGDIVFNRTNSLDLVGKAALFRETSCKPVSFASYLVRFRFNDLYSSSYANYLMGLEQLLQLAQTLALRSIGQANLNPNRYGQISFPVPPIIEQGAISAFLTRQLTELLEADEKIQESINLLTEYRSALITAAVTGQIPELQ